MNIKLSNENETTRELEKSIERLRHKMHVINIVFGSITCAIVFMAAVICPILVNM